MKIEMSDLVAQLAQLAQGAASDDLDTARESAILGARPAAVAALSTARDVEAAGSKADDAVLLPLEVAVAKCIAELDERMRLLGEGRQRADGVRSARRRAVEHIERTLASRGALPGAVVELEARHHELVELTWRHPGLPSWPTAGRSAWLDDLSAAGLAFAELKLSVCTPAEVGRLRSMLDALAPGPWASAHADICRGELVAAGARGF